MSDDWLRTQTDNLPHVFRIDTGNGKYSLECRHKHARGDANSATLPRAFFFLNWLCCLKTGRITLEVRAGSPVDCEYYVEKLNGIILQSRRPGQLIFYSRENLFLRHCVSAAP